MPVLFPLMWLDLVILGIGIALAVLSFRMVRRYPPAPEGPNCLRCGYSLRGLPNASTCPECGENLPVDLREIRNHRVLRVARHACVVWSIAFFLITLEGCRMFPAVARGGSDQHIRKTFQREMDIESKTGRYPLDSPGEYREVIGLTYRHEIVVPWDHGHVPSLWSHEQPVAFLIATYSADTHRNAPTLVADKGEGTFLLRHEAGHSTGSLPLTEHDVVRWFDQQGVDTTRWGMADEIAEIAGIMNYIINGYGSAPHPTPVHVDFRGHVPVGSFAPYHHPASILVIMLTGALAWRYGRNRIAAIGLRQIDENEEVPTA